MRPARRAHRALPRRPRSLWRHLLDWGLTLTILGLLILLAARLERSETHSLEGRATVNDGDSITLGLERIRLRGVDAPELHQTCKRGNEAYPCGRRSRDSLAAMIGGRPVHCTGSKRDRYDRLLAVCTAGGVDLNRGQIEAGWAVAYGGYEAEELVARGKGAGLWGGSFDRPRDWRESHGGMAESEHAEDSILAWLRQVLRFW